MTEHFNGLTPAEAERIAMLMEEAGEIVQACGKILRHGYESHHPDGGQTNRDELIHELIDLSAVAFGMTLYGDIELPPVLEEQLHAAWGRKLRYTHHQS